MMLRLLLPRCVLHLCPAIKPSVKPRHRATRRAGGEWEFSFLSRTARARCPTRRVVASDCADRFNRFPFRSRPQPTSSRSSASLLLLLPAAARAESVHDFHNAISIPRYQRPIAHPTSDRTGRP